MDNLGALIFDSFIKGIGISIKLLWQGLWANPWVALMLLAIVTVSILVRTVHRRS